MNNYQKPSKNHWTGRVSNDQLYLHEKIQCLDLENDSFPKSSKKRVALLGYACDEGVKRNFGRVGAAEAPNIVRKMIAPLSNHFTGEEVFFDVGNILCPSGNLEETQKDTTHCIAFLLENHCFPVVIGGGHDLAYAHFKGIQKKIGEKKIGIINFDAHFDLRKVTDTANSGTPFFQIAKETDNLQYLCLGIQKESNNQELYRTAHQLGVTYLENTNFNTNNKEEVVSLVENFIADIDCIYLTIDLDGFASHYAPGVSAPSPFGFSIDIALEIIRLICKSNKLISVDVVELNPKYDIDQRTARLAARIIYNIIDWKINAD